MLGAFGRHGTELRFTSLRWNDKIMFDSSGVMTVPSLVVENATVGCLNNPILTDKVGLSRAGLNSFFEFYTDSNTSGTFTIPLEYWNKNYESNGAVILKATENALLTMPATFDNACVAEQYNAALRVHMSFLIDAAMYYNGWLKITASIQKNGNTVCSSKIKLRNLEMEPVNFPATLVIDDVIIVSGGDEINVVFDYEASDIYKGIFILPDQSNTYGNFELLGFLTSLND